MADLAFVSVIMPTHNRTRLLPLTLSSVLWQQGVDLEVLVIDDGSAADVRSAIEPFQDDRVRLLRQASPRGVCAARNRGVAAARGPWIAFLDDDDLWAPDKLSSQLRAAHDEGRRWVYTGAVNVTEDLRLLGGGPPAAADAVAAALPRVNLIPGGCSGVMVHRDFLPGDPFDPSCRYAEDWDLWIRLSHRGLPARVGRPLVGYRVHGGNRSLDIAGMVAMLDVIETRYGGPVDRSTFYQHIGRLCQRASRHGEALRFYARAAAADPQYGRTNFVQDLLEVGQGFTRKWRRRLLAGSTAHQAGSRKSGGDASRYAAMRPWLDEARPWLEALAAHHAERGRRRQA